MEVFLCIVGGILIWIGGFLMGKPKKGGHLVKIDRAGDKPLWRFEVDDLDELAKKDHGQITLKIVTLTEVEYEKRTKNMSYNETEREKEE